MDDKKTAPQERGADKRQGSICASVMQVIVVKTAVGTGTEQDPNRIVTEYWSMEGELLAVHDPENTGDSQKIFNGTMVLVIDGDEVCGGKFANYAELQQFLDGCGNSCRVQIKVFVETEPGNSEMGRKLTSSATGRLLQKDCKTPSL